MLEDKLEQLSQLKRQLHKQQKDMDKLTSQHSSPAGTSAFNKQHVADALKGQDQVCPHNIASFPS